MLSQFLSRPYSLRSLIQFNEYPTHANGIDNTNTKTNIVRRLN